MFRLNTKIRLTMLCLSGFDLYSIWVPLMFAAGDVFKMLVFCPVLVRQYTQYGNVLCMWLFFWSQYVSTLSTAMFFVCVYFFGPSTLVRLVRPCSMHVCILFGLSTLVRLVQPCSMYVGIFSVLVCWYAQYGHVLCMLVFYSVLVRLVRPCSKHVGISFGLSMLSSQLFHFHRHACMAFFSFTTEHSM